MIRFSKYHGCGNSFVIVREKDVAGKDFSTLAEKMCCEQTGIGADGFIVVRTEPELEMVFYNRDGSRAPMCGNGIRCFARFCYDEDICTDRQFPVETLAGRMIVEAVSTEPFMARINMGKPVMDPAACGIEGEEEPFLKRTLKLDTGAGAEKRAEAGAQKCAEAGAPNGSMDTGGKVPAKVEVSSIFMGTIHTVLWTKNLDRLDKETVGSTIAHHPVYTEQTNVNMVQQIDRNTLKMRTYERGVGMTLACGTGACASAVIGILEDRCDKEVDVLLPEGKLHISQSSSGEIFMTGPAVKVADGTYTEEE